MPEPDAAAAPTTGRARLWPALRRSANWVQLAKFCTVGASGYVVNLAVYWLLLRADVHYLPAAVGSFLVAVTKRGKDIGRLRDIVVTPGGDLRAVVLEGGERVPFHDTLGFAPQRRTAA